MLRKKAAEELKKEQERKAAERRRIIEERCGKAKDLDNASEGICFVGHKAHSLFLSLLVFRILYHFLHFTPSEYSSATVRDEMNCRGSDQKEILETQTKLNRKHF